MSNKIIPYNSKLKEYARQLRKNSTFSEVLLWQQIKQSSLGVQFHRQTPLLEYIVDFYCHELRLAIEIDGNPHDHKYEHDAKREGELEKWGVRIIRFSDNEVKKQTTNVLQAIQDKVNQLLENAPQSPWGELAIDEASSSTSAHAFPKKERLTHKRVFDTLFKEGRSIRAFPLQLRYIKVAQAEASKIKVAFSAPKRNFKSAVQRNRIKRMVREAYRLNKPMIFNNIEGNFAFLFLYLGKKMPVYSEVESSMKKLLQDFLKKESHEKNY